MLVVGGVLFWLWRADLRRGARLTPGCSRHRPGFDGRRTGRHADAVPAGGQRADRARRSSSASSCFAFATDGGRATNSVSACSALRPIEFAWTVVPTLLAMIPFVWGARLYLEEAQPPASSMEVYVVAKQWMWKTQQPDGQAEINALHVPVGQSIKLTMTSQDVIHSFSVPAFRLKADVLPGRFTTLWFQATQLGRLSAVLLGVLRHRPLGDARHDHRDAAGGLRRLVDQRRDRREFAGAPTVGNCSAATRVSTVTRPAARRTCRGSSASRCC